MQVCETGVAARTGLLFRPRFGAPARSTPHHRHHDVYPAQVRLLIIVGLSLGLWAMIGLAVSSLR